MRMRRPPPSPSIAALLVALLLASAQKLHAQTPVYPTWWASQGLISGSTPSDYSAANQGQAKNMAVGAVYELDGDLAQFGGAGSTLDNLAVTLSATSSATSDYSVINLGQLKSLAQPFYNRLLSLGYTLGPLASGTYPWAASGHPAANDFAAGNIGQLKFLFSFDVNYSASGDTIPDWWVNLYSLGTTVTGTSFVPWSAGQLTYQQAYQQGLNPVNYYNGQTPVLTIVSGNNQTGPQNGLVPYPLVVSITDTYGNPLNNAPITFSVTSGAGQFQRSSVITTTSTSETYLANSSGQAEAFFILPNVSNTTCTITVAAGPPAYPANVTFYETSDAGGKTYRSPFIPSNVNVILNGDGSLDMSWQNNTDPSDQTPIPMWVEVSGSWKQVGSVPAGTTYYHIPPQ